MTRLPCVAVLLACALLASSQPAAAQCNSAPPVRSPSDLGAYRDWCKSCGGTFHYNGSMSSIRCVPGPDWGRKTNTDNLTFDAYSGWYQAAYAFIRWVVGGSDPRPRPDKQQLELQRRLMMQELRRRQEAAALERREAEARFLAQVYNRLAGVLKLTEGLALQFKEIDIGGPLTLKLSDTIAQGSPSGLQPKLGDPGQVAAALRAFDPEKMTPQALADVAELVGRLPPEALQRALAQAEQDARSDAQLPAVDALQQQADVSQAAANDADADDASAKARVGFDTPQAPGPVQMGTGTTPDLLREPGTAISPEDVPAPAAAPPPPGALLPEEKYAILKLLFPAPESRWPGARNPDEPLDNPLREEQSLKANLEGWDRWAVERAKGLPETAPDPILSVTEWSLFYKPLDRVAVAEFAPDLLNRFDSDGEFAYELSTRLRAAERRLMLPYYRAQAEVHKAAALTRQAEMEKLAAEGKIERLAPLSDQFRRHPERKAIVWAVWDRLAAERDAALQKARADFSPLIDKEHQAVFNAIRGGKT